MLISISDHESFWGGVSDWEGWGGRGGDSHLCLLLSDLSLNPGLEGSFLSCQLLLVQALFNPDRFKMCSRGWKVRPAVQMFKKGALTSDLDPLFTTFVLILPKPHKP